MPKTKTHNSIYILSFWNIQRKIYRLREERERNNFKKTRELDYIYIWEKIWKENFTNMIINHFLLYLFLFFTLCLKDHDVGDEIDEVEEN